LAVFAAHWNFRIVACVQSLQYIKITDPGAIAVVDRYDGFTKVYF
jgi:hypothetical protein